MARYIDANELLHNLPDDLPYKASVKRVLIQAPEADVVEVVRCKDCNFRGTEDCPRAYWLELEGDYVDPTEDDDFCSYGERRDTE